MELCAQSSFGLRANAGLSKMITKQDGNGFEQKFYFEPSWKAGVYFRKEFGKQSLLDIEVLFSRIGGKEDYSVPVASATGPTKEYWILKFKRHISYLAIPLAYGFISDRLVLKGGGQLAFALESDESFSYSTNSSVKLVVLYDESERPEIVDFDYGLCVGFAYELTKNLSFEADYYHGLMNIYKGKSGKGNWKNRQITTGLCYAIFRTG